MAPAGGERPLLEREDRQRQQKRLCHRSSASLITASLNNLGAELAEFKYRILRAAIRFLCAVTHEAHFKENRHFKNPIFLPFSLSFDENT